MNKELQILERKIRDVVKKCLLEYIEEGEKEDATRKSAYDKIKTIDPERAEKFRRLQADRDRRIFAGKDGYNVHSLGRYLDIVKNTNGEELFLKMLSKNVKRGDENSINVAGNMLANIVADNSIIIPVPQHTGRADYTLKIANIIANLRPNCVVVDLLRSNQREMIYTQKKNNNDKVPDNLDLGFKKRSSVNCRRLLKTHPNIYLLDNTIASGTTFIQSAKIVSEYFGVEPVMLTISACNGKLPKNMIVRYANYLDKNRSYSK